jgi:hypothetical protein
VPRGRCGLDSEALTVEQIEPARWFETKQVVATQ